MAPAAEAAPAAAGTRTGTPVASRRIRCRGCGRAMRSRLLASGETFRHYCQPCFGKSGLCELRYGIRKHDDGKCGMNGGDCFWCRHGAGPCPDSEDEDAGCMMDEDEEEEEEDDPCSELEMLCPVWFERLNRGMYSGIGAPDAGVVAEAWGWSDRYGREGGEHLCQTCVMYGDAILDGMKHVGSDVWVQADRLETAELFASHYFEVHDGREDERGYAAYYDKCVEMRGALDALETSAFRLRRLRYDYKRDDMLRLVGELRLRFRDDMHYRNNAAHDRELYDEVMGQFDGAEKNLREGFR